MDLNTVTAVRRATDRADLADLGRPDTAVLAGGTWMYSDPQVHLRALVDVTGFGWPALTVTDAGLEIAATCTLAELSRFAGPPRTSEAEWTAVPLFRQCCTALVGSFKVWNVATVGGNICLALPAGPMTSLCAALDGFAVIWAPGGDERRVPVAELVLGDRRTALAPDEVLRAVEIPERALRARTAYRKVALSPQGRSGSLVIGRVDPDGGFVLTVTAATDRPYRFAFPAVPPGAELAAALGTIPTWYDDPHGAPDWRQAVTGRLAQEIRDELA
jgi:CO/xanthine dehydrogenase FAD-binding subunit